MVLNVAEWILFGKDRQQVLLRKLNWSRIVLSSFNSASKPNESPRQSFSPVVAVLVRHFAVDDHVLDAVQFKSI